MINTFDELYVYFSEVYLTKDRTSRECDLIEGLCRLNKNDHVLDLGCGHGRISNELARRGYRVTGVDWCERALEVAVNDSLNSGVEVDYQSKNFLSATWDGQFDCVISWYTSFGYAGDKESQEQLSKIKSMLKEGGVFLIDHINRDRYLANRPAANVEERDGNLMVDYFDYDVRSGRLNIAREFNCDGRVLEAPYSIRLFALTELKGWLEMSGFKEVSSYGITGEAFCLDSKRMILVGMG
ncbi:class I SAM-dependent methyltransferase [Pseudomonas sp. SDI]|uniref:class I SAM-dependent methyltransferase n=1 Tax=Pseudomonas sp. SDI TaxID=2170734 RepID=UPI000DE75949|nr:methyltransferase domain-containing protein [Pseudomonas sp. SDI]PWB35396.1 class I SAM-dependent methyltransferase [Pseudomonas sp. SDI]